MKIVIIGAVAAGTSAAAKARRNDEEAEIRLYEMDSDISYAGCGLPYYIGTEVESRAELVPRDTAFFKKKYNVDIYVRHRVMEIDPAAKLLTVENMTSGQVFQDSYDKLVISTGARSVIPPIEGIASSNVFALRNVTSADKIRNYIIEHSPATALIIGSGFIGIELAENLSARGIRVSMVEMAEHVMASLDKDIAIHLEKHLREKGISLFLNDSVVKLGDKAVLRSGIAIDADLVIVSVGAKPNTELAAKAGIAIGSTGAIQVNKRMQTNFEDIYACGDCAESYSLITGKPIYRPLGSTANKTGRIVGEQLAGKNLEFRGILGTSIFRAFELTVAQTGLSEKEALQEGYDIVTCHNMKYDKPEYLNGKEMMIKAIADKNTGKVLGTQIIGKAGVDKRIDVFATAISFGAKAEDLFHLDLAYAPPFSTAKDPVMYTGMILDNAINRNRKLISPKELKEKIEAGDDLQIIDARIDDQFGKSHVKGAENIPLEHMREAADKLDRDKFIVSYCNRGVTSNAAQNILINKGFKNAYNLSGGYSNFKMRHESSCVDKSEDVEDMTGIDFSEKDTGIKDISNKNQ